MTVKKHSWCDYYEAHEIPKVLEAMAYVTYGIAGGDDKVIRIRDYDSSNRDRILIAAIPITVEMPEIDLRERAVESLKATKQKLIADHVVELNSINDRIQQLLMIEGSHDN